MKRTLLICFCFMQVLLFGQVKNGKDLFYKIQPPRIASEKPPVLILLHGYGSNEEDLFSLAPQLPDQFLIISVRAPFSLGNNGYAWYSIDFSTGKIVGNKEQAEISRKLMLEFMSALPSRVQYDEKQVYVCGFSQGAILSYSLGLTRPDLFKGIGALSGRILDEIQSQVSQGDALNALRIFIAHGTQDPMISIDQARASHRFLESLNLKPTYHEYENNHSINGDVLRDWVGWLNGG